MLDEWDDVAVMRNIENKRAIKAEVCRAQNAESERQDGLSLTGATQKEAQEPVGCLHRDYTGAYYVEPTRPDIARHLGKELFTTPQPPAPCPKCRQFQDEAERDALQAKVAELEAEAAENCRIIGMSGEVEARHLARIADLEKVAQAYEDQVAAHNKTLNELARKVELIDEQKGTIRALNMALGGDGSTSTENLIDANEFDAGDKGLVAERDAAQEDAARYRWSIYSDENAEILYSCVMSGVNPGAEIDADIAEVTP